MMGGGGGARTKPRTLWCALVCLAIAASASTARADESPDAVYARAGELSREGQYVAALEAIEAGLKASPGHHNLLRLRAEVALARRDFEGALVAYEAFLAAGPRGANKRKAKKIVDNLAAVRTTSLELTVATGPAQVYIDSKAFGVVCVAEPVCKKGLLPGRYRVFIEREGFQPLIERVDIALGNTTKLERSLTELPSPLTLKIAPADAQVQLDGQPITVGPDPITVQPGDHSLSVSAPGHAPQTATVSAHAGQPVTAQVTLAERIPVNVSIPTAELTLDGKPVTLDGGALVLAPDGQTHTLIARANGYRDTTVTISTDRQRGAPIEVRLDRVPPPEPPAPPPPPGRSRLNFALTIATGGLAIAGAGVAAISGVRAADRWDRSKEFCDSEVRCNQQGFDLVNEARDAATMSNISTGVALASGTGFVLLLVFGGGDAPAESPPVTVGTSPDGTGVGVGFARGF